MTNQRWSATIRSLAKKDLHVIWRDRRALVILLAMPVVFILILGISLGEGFGQKPDDRLRVSVVDLDEPPPRATAAGTQGTAGTQGSGLSGLFGGSQPAASNVPDPKQENPFGLPTWSKVIERDLAETAGIRVELIPSRDEAQRLVRSGKRAAVLFFGPAFSTRVGQSSFLSDGINPFYRDGVDLAKLDVELLRDPTQLAAASIIEQVAQITVMRVVIPWMIGRAFDTLGERLGKLAQAKIKLMFPNYDFTAKTWAGLTRQEERPTTGAAVAEFAPPMETALLNRGAYRYQILVPSYTVMFAFFLVLTCGWLFAAERRQGTLKRLRAAPLSRTQLLIGKMLPCLVVSIAQGLFLLGAGKLLFGLNWGTQPHWLIPVVVTTSLAATGMALLVAAIARTETQVMIYGTMLVLMMAGISGCLMPRTLMPEQMKVFSLVTPHAWALDAYTQLLLNPQPELTIVAVACFMLTGFGAVFFALSYWLLRLE